MSKIKYLIWQYDTSLHLVTLLVRNGKPVYSDATQLDVELS